MNKENIPKGATHWDDEESDWMRLCDVTGQWFFLDEVEMDWKTYNPSEKEVKRFEKIHNHDITVKYQGDKPTQGSELAAGYDVRASEEVVIYPHSIGKITATTKMQMPNDILCHLMARSSICNKQGLILMNSVGLIDSDYTGDLIFNFWNLSENRVTIKKGERIGQAVFHKRLTADFVNEEFTETKRGENGFGSSGVM